MANLSKRLTALEKQLHREANALFKSDEYRKLFSMPMTKKRAQLYMVDRGAFVMCRRGCWASVQARAPLDVKKMIWHHERDELAGNEERGAADHYTLGVMEAKSVGLGAKQYARRTVSDSTLVCTMAWSNAADRTPWLEGCAVLGALEISNADGIIRGGGQSHRMADKLTKELGIPLRKQPSNTEHIALEDEHSKFLMVVAKRHVKNQDDCDQIMSGARKTWAINKMWLGGMADAMSRMPNK
jgi:pyrroloquinoline quinone (PQQ) biosynthesis protein C